MIIVAHRGNLDGPDSCNHNIEKLHKAIQAGFYVELDLWLKDGKYYLGHDKPEQQITLAEFDHPQVFFHLKNLFLPTLNFADAFAIHQDNYALTLRGKLWCNYGAGFVENSIVCAPELVGANQSLNEFLYEHKNAWGICTDYGHEVSIAF
jgi:hypothetical protein